MVFLYVKTLMLIISCTRCWLKTNRATWGVHLRPAASFHHLHVLYRELSIKVHPMLYFWIQNTKEVSLTRLDMGGHDTIRGPSAKAILF